MIFVRFGDTKSLGSSFFGAWANFHWNYERSFAERIHNFLMQLPMQLIFGGLWDLDNLQIGAKGKSILEFPSVWKEIQKMQKIKTQQKSTKNWFDWATLWSVYVYLISSTSMQKENPFWKSVRQIKIWCAKYKGPLLNSMKISLGRVEKYLIFSALLAATKIMSK